MIENSERTGHSRIKLCFILLDKLTNRANEESPILLPNSLFTVSYRIPTRNQIEESTHNQIKNTIESVNLGLTLKMTITARSRHTAADPISG